MVKVTTEVLRQYVATALWSSTGDDDRPLDDKYTFASVAESTLEKMEKDLESFMAQAGPLLNEHDDSTMWAHDLWLTRNGHGCGFWDGDWPEGGDALTELSEKFGEVYLYVGDDGLIHQSP